MIGHDEPIATSLRTLPLGELSATSGQTLSIAMDALQSSGLLGLSPDKRRAALKELSPDEIRQIQTTLISAGFKDVGEADGIAGSKTIKGIEQALAKNTLVEIFAENDASDKETVRRIQESLNILGHKAGKIDGTLGPITAGAIGRYLDKDQLGASSLPGNVRDKLKEHNVSLKTETSTPGADGAVITNKEPALLAALGAYEQNEEDVKLIQGFLKKQGYDVGKIDGDFGPATTRQFVKFLEEHPEYHAAIGPNLLLETEIYATSNKVSDELRQSLNLRDLTKLPTADDNIRYQAYKDYFASQGKPEDLARGIKVASELTGVPMEKLFVVMKQESINFGDYDPSHGNSSANRIANNYGQFTNQTYKHMNTTYGDTARNELGREGIYLDGKDWRSDPLVAPYMVAKYLQETGSYPAYVLPVMKAKGNSDAIVAQQYPAEAKSNRHIFFEDGKALSFSEAKGKIIETLDDDYQIEREIVITAQRESLKKDLLHRQSSDKLYMDDSIDLRKHGIDINRTASLVGDDSNPEKSTAKLDFAGSFKQAALIEIADLSHDPNGKGPKPSGWAPTTNDFG